MKIALIAPFFSGSHKAWALAYQKHSSHEVKIFSLPGRHWKWRMHGGAIALAIQYMASDFEADLLLTTDMLDLNIFLTHTRQQTASIPSVIYFHENQLTYPWSPTDQDKKLKRDNHYAFINYSSALAADLVCFNSNYHRNSFLEALPDFLNQFPDHQSLQTIKVIEEKSRVLSLGVDLAKFDLSDSEGFRNPEKSGLPILLWNHRWEYDKNPEPFFQWLFRLQKEKIDFRLIVLGESYQKSPPIFAKAKQQLANKILHWGYAKDFATYARLLWQADILPVSSRQDFFGISVVEAMYCQTWPILPNRLAFPEHLPVQHHKAHLYGDDQHAYALLKEAIEKIIDIRKKNDYSSQLSDYKWIKKSKAYDLVFYTLII